MLITGTAVYKSANPFDAAVPTVIDLNPAARHKTAPVSCGVTLVSVAGRISSVMTLTAEVRK